MMAKFEILKEEKEIYHCDICGRRTIFFIKTDNGISYCCPKCYNNYEKKEKIN